MVAAIQVVGRGLVRTNIGIYLLVDASLRGRFACRIPVHSQSFKVHVARFRLANSGFRNDLGLENAAKPTRKLFLCDVVHQLLLV